MATRAELEQLRRALNRLSANAKADLRAVLAQVDPEDTRAVTAATAAILPLLVAEYGSASAALGVDMAEAWAADLGLRPSAAIATPAAERQVMAYADWAIGRQDAVGNLLTITDELVKQPYRDSIQQTAHRSGGAWARVPMGAKTCAFCVMTASRGAVYKSSRTAGADRKYHGDCDCQVVLVRGPEDYPEGYDPEHYFDIYDTGWSIAKSEGHEKPTTKQILAGMRKAESLN